MPYNRMVGTVLKAYGAWALVADGVRAYPAGYWASTDFVCPAVDMPTFRATDPHAKQVEWVKGTITYVGPIRDGGCYFRPHHSQSTIPIPSLTGLT